MIKKFYQVYDLAVPVFLIILMVQLVSCFQRSKLKTSDISVIPYKGREVLVFKNNYGIYDSIFLTGYKTVTSEYGTDKCIVQRYVLNYDIQKRYGFDFENGIGSYFIYLESNCNGRYLILISFWHEPLFIGARNIDSLNLYPKKDFKVRGKKLTDVIVFEDSRQNGKIIKDSAIVRMYWSIKKGLVGYEFKNKMQWNLDTVLQFRK